MKIVIVGCGNVGFSVASSLIREGHDITIIDVNQDAINNATLNLDVMGIVGNGATLNVLKEADIAHTDLLIAVTDSDERNLLTCLIARKAGHCNTIARVRNPEYKNEVSYIKEELGLSMVINPEFAAAREIERLVKFPSAIEINTFAKGRVELLKFEVKENCPLVGMTLRDMHTNLKCDVLVCIVERGDETFIPKGDFVIEAGDLVSFVAPAKKAASFFKAMGMLEGKAKVCFIVGGGAISEYLATALISSGISVKIFDKDKKRASELADLFPEAIIINGDGGNKDIMAEEGIERTEAFVALTNHDEENVMMSIYARKVNPKTKLITKVHRSTYDAIINDMKLGSIINPKKITADSVVEYVRAYQNSFGSNVETLYQLNSGRAEALEFVVRENSKLVNVPLMEISLKPDVLISCIIHNGVAETPKGSSRIQLGDTVIVVTTTQGFNDIKDILQ